MRSVLVQAGRFTCRPRMINGWRGSAFSATSSDLPLARSVSVPSRSQVVSGLVQVVERPKSQARQARDERENPPHSVHSPFVKMSRCMLSIVPFLSGIGKEQEPG